TAVYASEREIPDGITRIQADLSTRRPDGYLGSSTLTDQSRAILGADALDPAGNARWASVIQHETLHLAGLDESYVQSGDLSVNSPASQKGSVMGLLYDVPESHLTAKDLTDIAHPPIEPNQGMRSSPPGFGSGQNVQVYDNYLP